jgi:3-hydroxyisobutyrate dehydrogenase-like beta-hydroxyacid dehydrogenase
MGSAMVGRLRGAGLPVVVFNRGRARAEEVAATTGAEVASTAREAAAGADVVLVSLADDAAVRAVYGGPDGLVAGLGRGAIVLEASTIAPQTAVEVAALVAPTGATLLDTPVSGSVSVVESGALTVMVGGEVTALGQAQPVLDVLAKKVIHLGEVGAGATMKLAVNSVILGLNQAVSEALVLAERSGVARHAAYEVFANSAVAAPFVLYKREAFENPDDAAVAFRLDLVVKDLTLVAALADHVGARLDQAEVNRRVAEEACAAGMGGADISAVAVYLRQAAGSSTP